MANNWVSCKDRMPEVGEKVLIWVNAPDYLYTFDLATWQLNRWEAIDSECFFLPDLVTHWMTPEAPNE